ncbi:MAG: helix-turn-helix domain-containing protein [Candidatus Brocadiales bacterium]
MKFDTEELNQIADAVSGKVFERLKPLLSSKDNGNDTIFTVETLSEYLCVPKKKIYDMTHLKEIPHFKVGRGLRFRKSDIDTWLQDSYTPSRNGISKHFRGGVVK